MSDDARYDEEQELDRQWPGDGPEWGGRPWHQQATESDPSEYPSVKEEGWTAQVMNQLDLDLLLWGNAYVVDGKRVDPTTVTVHRRTPQGESEQVPSVSIHSQEEFLTALDILLDHTLHANECYIDDAQTECVCVIGKVRAALPPCGAVKPRPFGETGKTMAVYRCTRNAHPASPDRHTFG